VRLDASRGVGDTWKFRRSSSSLRAEVAELADAQASGACGRKVVEVQILSSAPTFAHACQRTRELRLASHAKVVHHSSRSIQASEGGLHSAFARLGQFASYGR